MDVFSQYAPQNFFGASVWTIVLTIGDKIDLSFDI